MNNKLLKKICDWEKNHLISQTQKQQIIDYEALQSSSTNLFMLITYLGIFCISLGVIAIISANWKNISDVVKLSLNFALLGASLFYLARAVIVANEKRQEYLILWNGLLLFASIGLIAQIYQIQGNFHSAIVFWCVLTLPFLGLRRIKIFPWLWVPCAIYGFLEIIWHEYLSEPHQLLSIVVCCLFGGLIFKNILPNLAVSCQKWAQILLWGSVVILDIEHSMENTEMILPQLGKPLFILGGTMIGLCGLSFYKKEMLGISGLTLLMFFCSLLPISGLVIFLCFAGGAIYIAYQKKQVRNINLWIILVGVRIFIHFCSLYLNLMESGLSLLGGGVILIILMKVLQIMTRFNIQHFKKIRD